LSSFPELRRAVHCAVWVMSWRTVVTIIALSSLGCSTPLQPLLPRDSDEMGMSALRGEGVQVPQSLQAVKIDVRPVTSSAAVPARPALTRETLQRCIEESLQLSGPTVTVVGADGDWSLDIDIQHFSKRRLTDEELVRVRQYSIVLNIEKTKTVRWSIAAAVVLRRATERPVAITDAWTSTLDALETTSYSSWYILGDKHTTHRTVVSFGELISALARQVAQETVDRIEAQQNRLTPPA
jgi:hypothetical protein